MVLHLLMASNSSNVASMVLIFNVLCYYKSAKMLGSKLELTKITYLSTCNTGQLLRVQDLICAFKHAIALYLVK